MAEESSKVDKGDQPWPITHHITKGYRRRYRARKKKEARMQENVIAPIPVYKDLMIQNGPLLKRYLATGGVEGKAPVWYEWLKRQEAKNREPWEDLAYETPYLWRDQGFWAAARMVVTVLQQEIAVETVEREQMLRESVGEALTQREE